jgi:hypothetical protein
MLANGGKALMGRKIGRRSVKSNIPDTSLTWHCAATDGRDVARP